MSSDMSLRSRGQGRGHSRSRNPECVPAEPIGSTDSTLAHSEHRTVCAFGSDGPVSLPSRSGIVLPSEHLYHADQFGGRRISLRNRPAGSSTGPAETAPADVSRRCLVTIRSRNRLSGLTGRHVRTIGVDWRNSVAIYPPGMGSESFSLATLRLGFGGRDIAQPIRRARPCQAASRSLCFCTFPVGFLGTGPKSTCFGALKCASRSRANAIKSSADTAIPSSSATSAAGTSPHFASGTAYTAHSRTAGC